MSEKFCEFLIKLTESQMNNYLESYEIFNNNIYNGWEIYDSCERKAK